MLAAGFFYVLLFMGISKTVHCAYRRIKDGKTTEQDFRFIVYLTKAEQSETQYDAWICGGAIVSKSFIVTSAACVEDVQYMYAISGYSKYVNGDDIDHNECTSASKKKIVFICVPRRYDFAYDPVQKWAFIDIAAVKVESPFRFNGPIPPGCSWAPQRININFDPTFQLPKTDAIVLGWGHTHKWREPGDPTDYNQEDLQYSSILIMNKMNCKRLYKKTPGLLPIIDAYMICAMNEGNLDDRGNQIKKTHAFKIDGCPPGKRHVRNNCEEPENSYKEKDKSKNFPLGSRSEMEYETHDEINSDNTNNDQNHQSHNPFRNQKQQNDLKDNKPFKANPYADQNFIKTSSSYNRVTSQNLQNTTEKANPVETNPVEYDDVISFEDIIMDLRRLNKNETSKPLFTRKAGICQNDHGGPLLTWVGKEMRLIGVASVFRIDKSSSCMGPYLFTSTQCNGAFLTCIVDNDDISDYSASEEELEEYVHEARISKTTTTTTTKRPRGIHVIPAMNELPDE